MSDKYKLFNKITIDYSDYKEHILSDYDKNKIFNDLNNEINKQNKVKKYTYKKLAIASMICICVSSVVLSNNNVWAMFENIGQQIEELLDKPQNEYKGFKVEVNQSVADSGLSVNLSEAMLNDGEIILSIGIDRSNFDSNKYKKSFYLDPYFYFTKANIYMDGKKFVQSSGWGGYESRNGKIQEYINSYSLSSIDTTGDDIPEIENYEILDNIDPYKDYDIKIVFDEIGIRQRGILPMFMKEKFDTVDGNWEFNFTINGKNIIGDTTVFDINKEIVVNNEFGSGKIVVDSLRISPVSARIKYTTKASAKLQNSIDSHNISNSLGIELFDQDGNNISGGGSGSSEDGLIFNMEMNTLLDNYDDLKTLKLVPFVFTPETNTKTSKKLLFEDKSIIIDLKK